MINREAHLSRIHRALRRSRIVVLVGPRQSGKTTLARTFVPPGHGNYFDLEDPASHAQLATPMTALARLKGTVVIDEVQRLPDIFPTLRVLADRKPLPARFLILGSASPALLRQTSETLAGRVEMIEMTGFSLAEVGGARQERHWRRGAFPLSFLARTEADSFAWRQQFVQLLLERDVPQLGIGVSAAALLRFWRMLAHYHGQIWKSSEPARSLGVSEPTVRRYLDLLTDLYMVRQLPPWHENLGKRQVKASKVYVRDSGLFHQLLGLRSDTDLRRHPKLGASWEGYVVEEILKALQPDEAYFWATHQGAELDLLMFIRGRRIGVEIKYADAPRLTTSMRIALDNLHLDRLLVVYPGEKSYALAQNVQAMPLAHALKLPGAMRSK